MARRKPFDDDDPPDPTPEELAAIAGRFDVPAPTTIGTAPSGGDELTDAEIEERNRQFEAARVIGPDITPPDMTARLTAALESLSARQADSNGNAQIAAAMVMLAEALQGLRTGQMQAAQLQADMQRRVTRPENAFDPQISAYNPRGDKDFPRPQLRCPMFLGGMPLERDASTREEIQLLNLLDAGEFILLRTDRTKIKISVSIDRKFDSQDPSRILISHETGFKNENQRQIPFDWIRQLAMANPKTRAAAAAVITMEEELALIAARKFNDGRQAREDEQVVSVGA